MPHIQQLYDTEIRSASYSLRAYAFHHSPPFYAEKHDIADREKYYKNYRGFAYMEGDEPLTFSLDIPMTQQIRGQMLPMSGIAAVASHPKVRRKGYIYQTIKRLLEVGKEEGSVMSALYPFRESFYQRMGYVSFPRRQSLTCASSALSSLAKQKFPGRVTMSQMMERYDAYRAFLYRHAQEIPGFAWNELGGWDIRVAEKQAYWLALAEHEGKVIGTMLYRIVDYEGLLIAERFYYQNSLAKYLLLHWLGLHEGQVKEIQINLPSYALQENLWVDLNPKLDSGEAPMGRVINVQGLEGIQVGPGSFSCQLIDPMCPWQEGVWRFEGKNGSLSISKDEQADCTLQIQGLSALVYGTHDPGDFVFRGWGNPSQEICKQMTALFSRQVPYIHESF